MMYICDPVAPKLSVAVTVSYHVPAGVVESAVILSRLESKVIPCKLVGLIA